MLSLFAAAKINLSLKVLGCQADGYHALESLVAFADIGDELFIKKAESTRFEMVGPFAAGLSNAGPRNNVSDNLVLQAVAALEAKAGRPLPVEIVLKKQLPIAAGIGGGSADAAAMLRGLAALYELDTPLDEIAATLGADVPVCLDAGPAWMSGIGHQVERVGDLPAADIVLVNPRVGVATRDVFAALNAPHDMQAAQAVPQGFDSAADLLAFLKAQGNDLQPAAQTIEPEIADCLAALKQAGAPYHAMSGSGATCFALCPPGGGKALAARYRTLRERDWVMAGGLLGS